MLPRNVRRTLPIPLVPIINMAASSLLTDSTMASPVFPDSCLTWPLSWKDTKMHHLKPKLRIPLWRDQVTTELERYKNTTFKTKMVESSPLTASAWLLRFYLSAVWRDHWAGSRKHNRQLHVSPANRCLSISTGRIRMQLHFHYRNHWFMQIHI